MKLYKFPVKLKELMDKNNFTQKNLAEKLDTTQQTISRWLKGENEPNLHTLVLLCMLLDTTPNYILGFDDNDKEWPVAIELQTENK